MKIERSRTVVSLYKGRYQVQLDELLNRSLAALRAEETAGPLRTGQGILESTRLGKEYDDLVVVAEDDAYKVSVFALPYDLGRYLRDAHPPREDNLEDQARGVNMDTYVDALLKASLVDDEELSVGADAEDAIARGAEILAEMSPTAVQYKRLATAAYNVNNGDDALPKFSLVSKLMELREPESKEPSAPE